METDLIQDVVEGLEAGFLFSELVFISDTQEGFEVAKGDGWPAVSACLTVVMRMLYGRHTPPAAEPIAAAGTVLGVLLGQSLTKSEQLAKREGWRETIPRF